MLSEEEEQAAQKHIRLQEHTEVIPFGQQIMGEPGYASDAEKAAGTQGMSGLDLLGIPHTGKRPHGGQ